MSTPQEEVTREREAIVVAETNRVEVVRVAEASIREAVAARERAAADVRDAKD
jgi:predicted  nucleic acid-binding Zn-ribbon protein